MWFFFLICFFFSWFWIVNEANSCVRESEREMFVWEGKVWLWKEVEVYLSKCEWSQMISNKRFRLAHRTSRSLRIQIFHLCMAGLKCSPLGLSLLQLLMCQSFCMLLICFVITFISRCDVGASHKLTRTVRSLCQKLVYHPTRLIWLITGKGAASYFTN